MCSSWHHSVTLEGTASSTAGSIFCRDKSVDRHSNNMEDMFIFTWSRWKLSDWQWQQELKLYWSLTHSAAATQTTTITFSFRLFQFPISNISMEHILKNDAVTGMSFQCKNAKGQDFRNIPGFLFKWRNIKITSKLSIPGIKCSTRIRYKCSIPISKSIFSKAKVYIRGNMSDPARSTAPLNENWTSDSFKVHWFCYTLTWRPVKFWKAKSSSKMKHNENKSINHHMTISEIRKMGWKWSFLTSPMLRCFWQNTVPVTLEFLSTLSIFRHTFWYSLHNRGIFFAPNKSF